jgi:hypothetical protein
LIDHFIKASLDRNCIITIMYQKGSEITHRNIKVLEIEGENIKAYCYLREQKRIFKRNNILAAAYFKETKNIRSAINVG